MSYKLTYFGIKGRGELPRLLFAAAGVKYEDKRLEQEAWPEFKKTTPLGSLPLLEVEGEVIPQSLAICRFLARRFKLFGANDIEEAKINAVLDTLVDYRDAFYSNFFEKDEAKKAANEKKLKEETVPKTLKFIEGLIKKNGGKGSFLVGKTVSVGDLAIYDVLEMAVVADAKLLDGFECIKALREKVAALPKIAKWLKERPQTDM